MFKSSYPGELFNFGTDSISLTVTKICVTTRVLGCTELSHYLFSAIIDEDVLRYEIVKKNGKKGYVSMITNYGLLNLELHCEMVSTECFN